jgi:hypothetical protein
MLCCLLKRVAFAHADKGFFLLRPLMIPVLSSTLSDYAQARHTRREAGIQCQGW